MPRIAFLSATTRAGTFSSRWQASAGSLQLLALREVLQPAVYSPGSTSHAWPLQRCVCVRVSHSVPKRPKKISAGGSSPLMSLLPTKLFMSWEDFTADHRDVPALWSYKFVPPKGSGCCRSFRSFMHCWVKQLCCRLLAMPFLEHAWLRLADSYMDTCTHQTSVFSPVDFRKPFYMARLPVWSLRVRAASKTQQLRISSTLLSLPFFLLCFLASRCGHVLASFYLTSRWPEMHSLDRTAPVWTAWNSPLQWISLTQKFSASDSQTSLQILLAAFNYTFWKKPVNLESARCGQPSEFWLVRSTESPDRWQQLTDCRTCPIPPGPWDPYTAVALTVEKLARGLKITSAALELQHPAQPSTHLRSPTEAPNMTRSDFRQDPHLHA